MALRDDLQAIRDAVQNILVDPSLDLEQTGSVLGQLSARLQSTSKQMGTKVDRERRQDADIDTRINNDITGIGTIVPDIEEP